MINEFDIPSKGADKIPDKNKMPNELKPVEVPKKPEPDISLNTWEKLIVLWSGFTKIIGQIFNFFSNGVSFIKDILAAKKYLMIIGIIILLIIIGLIVLKII